MPYIFQIIDKSGRLITLSNGRWKHIAREHPDVDIEEIKNTLKSPSKTKQSKYDPANVVWYYSFNKSKNRYLFVAVKYLNGNGFIVIT